MTATRSAYLARAECTSLAYGNPTVQAGACLSLRILAVTALYRVIAELPYKRRPSLPLLALGQKRRAPKQVHTAFRYQMRSRPYLHGRYRTTHVPTKAEQIIIPVKCCCSRIDFACAHTRSVCTCFFFRFVTRSSRFVCGARGHVHSKRAASAMLIISVSTATCKYDEYRIYTNMRHVRHTDTACLAKGSALTQGIRLPIILSVDRVNPL